MGTKTYVLIGCGVALAAAIALAVPPYVEYIHRRAAKGEAQGKVEAVLGTEAGEKVRAMLDKPKPTAEEEAAAAAQVQARKAADDLAARKLALTQKRLEIARLEMELQTIQHDVQAAIRAKDPQVNDAIEAARAKGKPIAQRIDTLKAECTAEEKAIAEVRAAAASPTP